MLKYKASAAAIKAAIHPRPVFISAVLAMSFAAAQGAPAAELVVNGGFEQPPVDEAKYEQPWMSYFDELSGADACEPSEEVVCPDETIPGWVVFWRDSLLGDGPAKPGRLELQRGDVAGATPKEGEQKAELDSHYRSDSEDNNVAILQLLETCPRTPYSFSYSWKARTQDEGDNDMLVLIDDEVILEHVEYRESWTDEKYEFIANDSGLSILGFTSIGTSTLLGMFIDKVSVTGADGSDPAACDPPPSVCGDKPRSLQLLYDADLNGEDYYNQDPSEVSIKPFGIKLPAVVKIRVYDHFRKANKRSILFNEEVTIGQSFAIEGPRRRIPPRLFIDIHETGTDKLLQSIEFHTSCSQPLNVGDEFGGIAIWGFTP
jgi:hypothetical protein